MARRLTREFNNTLKDGFGRREQLIKGLFGSIGERVGWRRRSGAITADISMWARIF